MTDAQRIRANPFNKRFPLLVLLYQVVCIDRWFQLLQFLQEAQIVGSDLLVSLPRRFNVERLAIYDKIGPYWL